MGALDKAMAKSLQRKLIDNVPFDQEAADEVERAFSLESIGFDSVARRREAVTAERSRLKGGDTLKKSAEHNGPLKSKKRSPLKKGQSILKLESLADLQRSLNKSDGGLPEAENRSFELLGLDQLRARVRQLETENAVLIRQRAELRGLLEQVKNAPAPRKPPTRDGAVEDARKIILSLEAGIVTKEEVAKIADENRDLSPDQRRAAMIRFIDGSRASK